MEKKKKGNENKFIKKKVLLKTDFDNILKL